MIGAANSALVDGSLHSARVHGLLHEVLTPHDVCTRYPVLQPSPEMIGVWERRAGVLSPEACVAAQLEQARRHGAILRFDEAVIAGSPKAAMSASTPQRAASGPNNSSSAPVPWVGSLLPGVRWPIRVERQVHALVRTAGRRRCFVAAPLPGPSVAIRRRALLLRLCRHRRRGEVRVPPRRRHRPRG